MTTQTIQLGVGDTLELFDKDNTLSARIYIDGNTVHIRPQGEKRTNALAPLSAANEMPVDWTDDEVYRLY